jgi:hypothetical protein
MRIEMSTHNFTLALGVSEVSPELEEALLEAGCDDATLYKTGGAVFLEFDREAPSREEAIISALVDVRQKADITVLRVVANDLVNAAQIAERLGRSRESIRLLIRGERGPGDFPPPVHRVGKRPLWSWGEVVDWIARNKIETVETDEASSLVEAVNNALGLLRVEGRLSKSGIQHVSDLLGERLRTALKSQGNKRKRKKKVGG